MEFKIPIKPLSASVRKLDRRRLIRDLRQLSPRYVVGLPESTKPGAVNPRVECPHCGYDKSMVIDSRGTRRRRCCLRCRKRYSTVEMVIL